MKTIKLYNTHSRLSNNMKNMQKFVKDKNCTINSGEGRRS